MGLAVICLPVYYCDSQVGGGKHTQISIKIRKTFHRIRTLTRDLRLHGFARLFPETSIQENID